VNYRAENQDGPKPGNRPEYTPAYCAREDCFDGQQKSHEEGSFCGHL
jgi:hypothetical protein